MQTHSHIYAHIPLFHQTHPHSTRTHTHTHTHTHTCDNTYAHAHTCIYIHKNTHIHTHRVSAITYHRCFEEINTSLNYTLILHFISGCNVNKDSIPLWSFGLHFIGWGIYPSHFILFVWYQKITRNKDTTFFVLLWSL